MEGSMLQKAEGFKYLYKEQFKEFGKLMEKRDKDLEMDNNYRQKSWNDNLDQGEFKFSEHAHYAH